MAIAITIETDIDRSPALVFAALADLAGWPSWLVATGIRNVAVAGAGTLAVGDRVTIDQRAAGRASVVEATITVLDPPSRFAIGGRDADGVSTTLDAALSATATGTRLRWSAGVSLPLRFRAFEGLARPQVERAARLDIEAFKRRLESAPGD
jgi:uncharacterized protein YndB with AHSA1/START domain